MKRERGLHFFTRFLIFLGLFFTVSVCLGKERTELERERVLKDRDTTRELVRRTEVGRNRYDDWLNRSQFGYRGNGGGNGYYRRGLFGRRRR